MPKITVCLDWTPNTNHAGFYVALKDGLYEKAGLGVEIKSPDSTRQTRSRRHARVAAGQAGFADAIGVGHFLLDD